MARQWMIVNWWYCCCPVQFKTNPLDPCPWLGSAEHDDHHHRHRLCCWLDNWLERSSVSHAQPATKRPIDQQKNNTEPWSRVAVYYYLSKEMGLWICIKRKRVDTFEQQCWTRLTFFAHHHNNHNHRQVILLLCLLWMIRASSLSSYNITKCFVSTPLHLSRALLFLTVSSVHHPAQHRPILRSSSILAWRSPLPPPLFIDWMSNCWRHFLAILKAIKIKTYDGITRDIDRLCDPNSFIH